MDELINQIKQDFRNNITLNGEFNENEEKEIRDSILNTKIKIRKK